MVAFAYLPLRVLVHGMSVVVKSSWIIVEDAVDDGRNVGEISGGLTQKCIIRIGKGVFNVGYGCDS